MAVSTGSPATLGRERMLQTRVVLPDAEHFPDPYDKNGCKTVCIDPESLTALFLLTADHG